MSFGNGYGIFQEKEPYVDLRNKMKPYAYGSGSFGTSYRSHYLPPPQLGVHVEGAEQMRLGSMWPKSNHVYRNLPLANQPTWKPYVSIPCAPFNEVRRPCPDPDNNLSMVYLSHGHPTVFKSETMDHFDRPSAQCYFQDTPYQMRSGFSTSNVPTRSHFWRSDPCPREESWNTDPQSYNPHPRFYMSYKTLLDPQYRPEGISYQESSIGAGNSAAERRVFIH